MERPNYVMYGDTMELVQRLIVKAAMTKHIEGL